MKSRSWRLFSNYSGGINLLVTLSLSCSLCLSVTSICTNEPFAPKLCVVYMMKFRRKKNMDFESTKQARKSYKPLTTPQHLDTDSRDVQLAGRPIARKRNRIQSTTIAHTPEVHSNPIRVAAHVYFTVVEWDSDI